jgi:carbonic anhydrase/acetyltransferase-like protein (isoleucine patch superfamily)
VIVALGERRPRIHPSAWVPEAAVVVGDVEIGPDSSLWFHTVVRGDVERIRIGSRTNVQDNATVPVVGGRFATIVGDGVTVGHAAVLHGCAVASHTLVGMGAIVLDGAEIGHECLVGAGAVVTPGTRVPPRSLVLGSPAKRVRELSADEVARLHRSAETYVERAREYRTLGVR